MKHSEQRRQNILQILRTSRKISIEQAMSMLDVSESTVRRLFAQLEREGVAIRTYGGICFNDAIAGANEYSFEMTKLHHPEEKTRIGKAAAQLIKSGDIIYLDSGTTVMSLCAEIDRMFNEAEDTDPKAYAILRRKYDNVTVFTHSLVNLNTLKKHMKVYLIGGEYREDRRDFCGYLTEEAIKNLRFTKCFIGADGYSETYGILASDFYTARINQLVAQNSSYRILLADSTKYTKSSVVCYAPFSEINCIVSDNGLSEDTCRLFRESGIEVITI